MIYKRKSEKKPPQCTCVLSYTGDQQVTLSKPTLRVICLIKTIADFAVKLFCYKHICKHLSWLKLFSALIGLVLTLNEDW